MPVLVTDLTEAEADEVLATLDPLASMAEPDMEALKALIGGIDKDDENLNILLEDIRDNYNVGIYELMEQATDAEYVPPDNTLGSNAGGVPENMKGLLLHFELSKYDEVMAKGYMLGEEWGLDNLADVFHEAIRRASDATG